jgi:hypothetical protein
MNEYTFRLVANTITGNEGAVTLADLELERDILEVDIIAMINGTMIPETAKIYKYTNICKEIAALQKGARNECDRPA